MNSTFCPTRRGAANRTVLIVLAVLLLGIAGALLAKSWMTPPTQPEPDVGRAVVEQFLELLRAGKAGEAWDATTAEFKSIEGRESFIRTAAKAPLLKQPLHFGSTQTLTLAEQPRTEYLFQSADGKTVRVLVGYERGDWKVDRLTM